MNRSAWFTYALCWLCTVGLFCQVIGTCRKPQATATPGFILRGTVDMPPAANMAEAKDFLTKLHESGTKNRP